MNDVINREINFGVIERPIEKGIQFNGKKYFNGGLLLIGKEYLNKKVKDDLLHLLQQAAPKDSRDILITSNKWVGNEPILNTYFETYATFIEKKYNFCIDECRADTLEHQYNLHFIGENKPWNTDKFDAYITNMLVKQNTQAQATQLQQQLIKFVHTNLNLLYHDFPMFLTRQTLHTMAKFNFFLRDLDIKP